MKISEFSVKHSLLVNLISLFILIAGFFTLYVYKIRREAFPEVSFDRVVISTVYPGSGPQEVEKFVTIPIEKELKGIDGIEKMESSSKENMSTIAIRISQDAKNKKKVVDDIRQAVDRVRNFPAEVKEDPVVLEITSGEIPVIEVALSGDLTEKELQDNAEILEDILEDIEGVSKIVRKGWRNKEVWIEADPKELKDKHVSLEEIIQSLRKRNVSIPAGKLRGEHEFSVRTTGEFRNIEEIENVIIRANEAGNWLRIKDVAKVVFGFEDENMINKSYGTRSINLTIIKRNSGDAVNIVERVRSQTNDFLESSSSELKVSYINDIAFFIKRRLGVLKNNGIVGIILVSCVLMMFLSFRIAILTALGLPIAFGATLAIMGFAGLSINLITMFGLIVVLGMVVDDGIIVAENCARYLEEGYDSREAAVLGASEVAKPVTTTVITTIAAFAPLLFLEGMLGKFIWGIPLVVIIALCASLFEALVILPSHFADFVKVKVGSKFKSRKDLPWFKNLINFYTRVLNKALANRYKVILGVSVLFILTIGLAIKMPKVMFGSEEGIEQFYVRTEAPVGTNLYATDKLIEQLERKIEELPKDEIAAYTTQVGIVGETWMHDPYGKSGSHIAQISVFVTPHTERKRTVTQIIEDLRQRCKDVLGFDKLYFEKEKEGPPVGKAIAVQVRGEEYPVLKEQANKIYKFLESVKGVSDITSDYEVGRREIQIVVDQEKAAMAFLSVEEIASSIRHSFKGGIATTIKPLKAEKEIDVVVRFPQKLRNKREIFDSIYVPNRFENLIPLSKISRLVDKVSMAQIKHLNGKRVITVRASVNNKDITSGAANALLAKEFSDAFKNKPGYSISYGGEQEENAKSMRSFIRAFILALFLIFLILAANFNSLIQPLLVMSAIAFGLIGVIWAFFFHGLPISFFFFIGVVGLTGIVVNDSIVLVEFINNLRIKGIDRRDSIVQAGQLRLRPVILTTITTALGLAPTAYGMWGGDPFLRPMALVIVWGIICATALTLIVIPCMYAIIDDGTLKLVGHGTVKGGKND